MIYSYSCKTQNDECLAEADFRVGKAPRELEAKCPKHHLLYSRDFGRDFPTLSINESDPYRKYHLGTKKIEAEGNQQRKIGGPSDKFELRQNEAKYGIKYIADDTSGMSAKAQRGIDRYRDKVRQGEV